MSSSGWMRFRSRPETGVVKDHRSGIVLPGRGGCFPAAVWAFRVPRACACTGRPGSSVMAAADSRRRGSTTLRAPATVYDSDLPQGYGMLVQGDERSRVSYRLIPGIW